MEPLPEFFEKLYFHEIEIREQVNSRLQMPLTLIIALAGVFAYLLQSFDRSLESDAWYLFVGLLALTATALAAGVYYFVRAAWGATYSFVPYAKDTDDYHKKLIFTYSAYDSQHGTNVSEQLSQKYLDNYLKQYFVDASTANARTNDQRSIHLHKANKFLILTAALAVSAFCAFVFGDLNRENKQRPLEVLITQPVNVRDIAASAKSALSRENTYDQSKTASTTPATSPTNAPDQRGRTGDRASTSTTPAKEDAK